MARPHLMLVLSVLGAGAVFSNGHAQGVPAIADRPPPFRIYDIDARERRMRALIAQLAGHPALTHQQADAALGELDDIKRRERAMRARDGGRLTLATIRVVDTRLNALSRRLGLREAPR